MSKETNATFVITGWNEETLHEYDGGKITRASVAATYTGAVEGPGSCEYTMAYRTDGSVDFFGYELITGIIAGKQGSFVFEHKGTFESGVANDTMTVVPGSATGELAALTGTAGYSVAHGEAYQMWFEYKV